MRRRPVYLFAGSLVCAATVSLSAFTWVMPSLDPGSRLIVSYLPLLSVVLMYTGFGIGYGPIVFILKGKCVFYVQNEKYISAYTNSGELLPSDVRSLGCGLLGVLDTVSMIIMAKTVPLMVSGLGIHGTFLLYSCCCLTNIIICFFVMPETKGLSLEEIEDFYKTNTRKPSGDVL